eukprot:13007690-Ditylum_brightwellii.AAC.1
MQTLLLENNPALQWLSLSSSECYLPPSEDPPDLFTSICVMVQKLQNREKATACSKEVALLMETTCQIKAQHRKYTLRRAEHIATITFPMVLLELRGTTTLISPVLIIQPSTPPVQSKYAYATTWLLCREG